MLPRLLTAAIVVAATISIALPAHAAPITVTTTDDELNTDGDCSLREAIRSANSDGADPHDACAAGSGNDTISLPAGTITLDEGPAGDDVAVTGDLDITSDMTITGTSARQSIIDGADLDRVFHVHSGVVTLSELTVRNGNAITGGGVHNSATLTLTRVGITDHRSSGDGAGIYEVGGTLTLIQSLVARNVTTDATGGGIGTQGGTLTIENSTVSGNQADCMGGGIALFNGADLTTNNVTIADNEADSPPGTTFDCPDPAVLNGGGVFVDGASSFNASNTLIGDNRDESTGSDPKNDDCFGTLTSQGYNLIEDPSGCTIAGTTTGNIIGQDPRLEALADNGGQTDTHALRNNSPAVDSGNPSNETGNGGACEPEDQRGFARPRGPVCDIGSFERGGGGQLRCFNKKATFVGTNGVDVIGGSSKRDVIVALGGDDVITTAGGNDLVCTGSGNDTVKTGAGTDQVLGESGNDRARGGGASDTLIGKAGRDKLKGQGGPDTLKGGGGKDRMNGGGADDVCKGGPGKDRLRRC
jgi:CSLREA domain-containing protein